MEARNSQGCSRNSARDLSQQGGRREPTPESYPFTFTHTHTHTKNNALFNSFQWEILVLLELHVPLLILGKWFVSTGKDNLLNAWRTPYGASIFQVWKCYLMAFETTNEVASEMEPIKYSLPVVFSYSPKNPHQYLAVTFLWMINT